MIFSWFNSSEAEQFGRSIAELFAGRVTSTMLPTNDKKSLSKAAQATAKVLESVAQFRKNTKLNTFQKAKFAKVVQSELLARGYDPKVVVDLVNLLVRAI